MGDHFARKATGCETSARISLICPKNLCLLSLPTPCFQPGWAPQHLSPHAQMLMVEGPAQVRSWHLGKVRIG